MISPPRGHVGHVRDEVAHRAAGDEQRGVLAGQLGRALLQGDDGGVVAEDVVADLGLRPWPGAWPGVGLVTVSERRSMKSGMVRRA